MNIMKIKALVLLSLIIEIAEFADVVVNVTAPVSVSGSGFFTAQQTNFDVTSCSGQLSTNIQGSSGLGVLAQGETLFSQFFLVTITDLSVSTITSTSTITVRSTLSYPRITTVYRHLPCDHNDRDY